MQFLVQTCLPYICQVTSLCYSTKNYALSLKSICIKDVVMMLFYSKTFYHIPLWQCDCDQYMTGDLSHIFYQTMQFVDNNLSTEVLKNQKKKKLNKKTFTNVDQHITSQFMQLLVDKRVVAEVKKSPQYCLEEQVFLQTIINIFLSILFLQ